MKKWMIILFAGAFLLTGCTTMKSDQLDLEIQSSKAVSITNVHVDPADPGIVVHGSLRPKSSAVTRVGHVDVEFLDENGSVLEKVKAETNTNLFSRKSSRRPTFSASTEIEEFHSVRLIHHPDTLNLCEL